MTPVRDFLRRARGWLTGLNAISTRFDLLQNRIDSLLETSRLTNETLAEIARKHNAENDRRRLTEQALADRFDANAQRSDQRSAEIFGGLQAQFDVIERRIAEPIDKPERNAIGNRLNDRSDLDDKMLAPWYGDALVQAHSGGAKLHQLSDGVRAGRIGFLMHSLELVNHYAAVWDLLPHDSFDVLLHGLDKDVGRQAVAAWSCGVFTTEEVLADGRKYDCLVSNHPVEGGEPPLIKRLAERNVRFMYAAGKSGWNLSDWNRLYDLILCFGPHHANAFATRTDGLVIQMGYPRFDRYFNEQVDRNALADRFGCDPAKKTVVWLPTWKDLSSVGYFDEEISALKDHFNVVVKLHPLMSESEPARVEALRQHHFSCLLTDSTDNLPLYQLADYMLFDFGGPPLAAIYCDKKMLLLDVPGALADPLLGPDSPDVAIRAQLGSLEPGRGAIARCLASATHWAAQVPMRKVLRRTYFAPHFGFSAAVVANALLRLDTLLAGAGLDSPDQGI